EVHTYDMDLSSPDYLPVTVADIIIDDPDQGKISAMVEDKTFVARSTTDRYPFLFPFHVAHNLRQIPSAAPSNPLSDNTLAISRPFNGTLTIKLADGFNITLPASTIASAIENTTADYNGPFYLSAAFLSQVYLMLDFDASKF